METKCLFCGSDIRLVLVHGHYQCSVCKTNTLPCCDGDNCNNTFLLNPAEDTQEKSTQDISPAGN